MKINSLFFEAMKDAVERTVPRLAWKAGTAKEHEQWRRKFAAKLAELLGHMPQRVPVAVQWREKMETKSFVRHKIYVRSESRYWIPAFYFVPKKPAGPRPAIICLHGHSGILPYIREGTPKQRAFGRHEQLDYAPLFAEHGYVTIAPMQRGWNETLHASDPTVAIWNNSCYRAALDAFLLGMTPIGLRVWDVSRLVDFLETRSEVAPSRIGVAGLSGGGTISLYSAAMDKRIRLAMIGGYFCTYRDSIFPIFHCICNCVPRIMEWGEMSDVAALIAPRPVLMISGEQDPMFPIAATRRAFRRLRQTYRVLDSTANVQSDFFEGGHMWSNRKTLGFLHKHFGDC